MADIEKIKLGDTSYDVRDATTLQNLTSAQETQLLADGSYNGEAVADGTVFTTDEGKFKEFEIDYAYSVGNATSQACDYSSKLSPKTNNVGSLAVMIQENGTHIITNDGTTQNVYETPFTCIRANYVNGVCFVSDGDHIIHRTTDFTNWTDFITLENATKNDISIVLFNGYYYIAYRKTNNLCVLKVSLDGTTSETVLDTTISSSADFGGAMLVSNDTYLCAFAYELSFYTTYYKTTDGSNWSTATIPANQKIRSALTINGVFYFLNRTDSKVYRTTDFSTWESSNTISDSNLVVMAAYKNTLAVVSASNGYVYICTDLNNSTFEFTKYTGKTDDGNGSECLMPTASGYVFSSYVGTSYYVIPVSETSTYSLTALSYDKSGVESLIPTVDQTYSASSTNAQSGVAVSGAIGQFLLTGLTAPTTSTVGTLGQLYKDTATGIIYKCSVIDTTDPQNPVYTWNDLIENLTTVDTSYNIGGTITNNSNVEQSNVVAIGNSTRAASQYATAIGDNARAIGNSTTAIGRNTNASGAQSTAIGYGATVNSGKSYAIQIGKGTNAEASTFCVGLSASDNYKLLDADGTIPGPRMSLQAAGAPTTSTAGTVGQFYVDTTNQDAYICVSDASSTYTWKKITP